MNSQPINGHLTTTFQDILDRVSVADILVDAGYEPHGNRMPCPLHEGKNPTSFHFTRACWVCHGCGSKGGLLDLVEQLHGVTRKEALSRLCGIAGISWTDASPTKQRSIKWRHRRSKPLTTEEWAVVNRFEDLKLWREGLDCLLRTIKRCKREGTIEPEDFHAREQLLLYWLEESEAAFIAATHDLHQLDSKSRSKIDVGLS